MMFVIEDGIHVMAPIERCFLLSTHVGLVAQTIGMRAVAGRASGLVKAWDRVVWRGWKFGFPQRHESLITGYEAPCFFQDSMARGRFRMFQQDHEFVEIGGQVLMRDTVRFSMPLGAAGRRVGQYVMIPYLRARMRDRFALLKRIAESEEWREYL
jgi:ligand-binding SRPBCC domain-containing protein